MDAAGGGERAAVPQDVRVPRQEAGAIRVGPIFFGPMKNVRSTNPFLIGVLARGPGFADRKAEVDRISRAFTEPGTRLVVFGERRLGKSSALEAAAARARSSGAVVAIASFATASDPSDAAQRVLQAVQEQLGRRWLETIAAIAARLNVNLEIGTAPETGLPRFRLGAELSRRRPAVVLPDVLDALQARLGEEERELGLGLDEFQRIHEWGGEDAEWALRESFQRHDRIAYVLAGSERGLIEGMVSGKRRALWKQVDVLPFGPIEKEELGRWIYARADRAGTPLSRSTVEGIVALAYPRTRDVIQLARAVWFDVNAGGEDSPESVAAVLDRLVLEEAALYERLWADLGPLDQMLLRLVAAAEGRGSALTSAATLSRWDLGAKSTVQSALDRLVSRELLTRGASGYAFDDPFFQRWVQLFGLEDIGLPIPPNPPRS